MSSSTPFSPRLDLPVRPSRLQVLALFALGLPAVVPPFMLSLAWPWQLLWLAAVGMLGGWEAARCGYGPAVWRLHRVGRSHERWYLEFGGGRRVVGELRSGWCNRWCAYIEIGTGVTDARSALIWRDSLSPDGFRHLRTHLRLA